MTKSNFYNVEDLRSEMIIGYYKNKYVVCVNPDEYESFDFPILYLIDIEDTDEYGEFFVVGNYTTLEGAEKITDDEKIKEILDSMI